MTMSLAFYASLCLAAGPSEPVRPFAISVVDGETGRGVPLVELRTVNEIRFVTDSAGVAAIDEPGLFGQKAFFFVKSHGYEFPKDGFGFAGKAVEVVPGGIAGLEIRRRNIAERLYRVTGGGLYRDSLLIGRKAPIKEPLLNAQVLGQDSVLMAPYRGKLYWFWGDTNRPSYPLGNFHTPGATSELPGKGGIDPDIGVDLNYFVDKAGFARPTAQLPGEGPTWLAGLAVVADDSGADRLVAGYTKIRPPMEAYETGLVVFDPDAQRFDKIATLPRDAPVKPLGHTFRLEQGGVPYIYYSTALPLTRVRARMPDLKDPTKYEAFTPLKTGSTLENPEFDRGVDGRLHYAWRANTPAVGPAEQARFIRQGKLKAGECLLAVRDVETGKPVTIHYGSTYWNEFRKRWVMVAAESGGTSFLGEIWFAEADTPVGPWVYARKVVTHEKYSFYNPKQHPEFARDGGRFIYFEGTYATTFSGNDNPTPRYDYNQVMYRLDLADPRLNLPVPVYSTPAGEQSGIEAFRAADGTAPIYFALEKHAVGSIALTVGQVPGTTLYVMSADSRKPPGPVVPLHDASDRKGYTTDAARAKSGARPVGLAWPAPSTVRIPPEAVGRD